MGWRGRGGGGGAAGRRINKWPLRPGGAVGSFIASRVISFAAPRWPSGKVCVDGLVCGRTTH